MLSAILPRERPGRILALGAGIDSLGTGMFYASATLYFVGIQGIPASRVALAVTLAGAVALLAPVPVGRLADRVGVGRSYISLLLLRGLGYACYTFVHAFAPYLVLTVLLTAADRAGSPLQQAVVSTVAGDQDRTRTMAAIRTVRNIGLTAGFLLAGVAFATARPGAFTALFLGNGLSFVVIAVLARVALRAAAVPAVRKRDAAPLAAEIRPPARNRWFVLFTVGNGFLSLYDTILIVLLPVWVLAHTSVPPAWVPVLLAVNTVLTVLLQVPMARFAVGSAAALRLLPLAGWLMAACCLLFALAQTLSTAAAMTVIVLAVVVLSVAENVHAVAAWELSADLSPPAARARYLGFFSLSTTGQKVVGPALLVSVLLPAGLIGWPVLASVFAGAGVLTRRWAVRGLAASPSPDLRTPLSTPIKEKS